MASLTAIREAAAGRRRKEGNAMRVHHLNCGTDCPVGGALFDGRSLGPLGRLVCHCLLIEHDSGLILVDTGYGLKDVDHPHRPPHPRITRAMRTLLNIRLRESETAVRQIEALGFKAADVRHILLTHLDFDHAGGLEDFPQAAIHVMSEEFTAATGPRRGFVPRNRYRPSQFDEVRDWQLHAGPSGEPWFGFEAVRGLGGLPPEILMVPLPGHTWGHAGIAVDRGAEGWLLHAGDAYFYRHEVRRPERKCTPGLRAYQTMMEVDRERRLSNQARLRALSIERAADVKLICAHDPVELEAAMAGRPL
ncbi:MAG TPA: MBL fold metallo-hydrolase [Allosphingosinicella sp.]|jgi:glyoxylase-like metal-dependent hydrolase (beta-lactamase superfamily II)